LSLALLWLAVLFCAAAAEARAAADPPGTEPAITTTADTDDGEKENTDDDKTGRKTKHRNDDRGDDEADAAQGTGGGDEFHRWGFSLHAGASIPHPDFSDSRRPGPNFGVDLEYRFNKYFSLEAVYTFHRFGGERLGPFGPGQVFFELDDVNLHQFSVNGKLYAAGGNSPFRPFVNLGGGAYKFDPGSTRGGVNLGGGLQFDVTEKMAVEGAYNFHNVFGFSGDLKFSTVQAGVRFRF
jgi:opacity protein-like surface antigen